MTYVTCSAGYIPIGSFQSRINCLFNYRVDISGLFKPVHCDKCRPSAASGFRESTNFSRYSSSNDMNYWICSHSRVIQHRFLLFSYCTDPEYNMLRCSADPSRSYTLTIIVQSNRPLGFFTDTVLSLDCAVDFISHTIWVVPISKNVNGTSEPSGCHLPTFRQRTNLTRMPEMEN